MADIEAPERARLRRVLEADFEVLERLSGTHKHGGERVLYDLVLKPRQHLIEKGFEPGFVVVEVKLFGADDRKKHDVKMRDLLWQCIVYNFSEITLDDGSTARPLFCLYFIGGEGIDPDHRMEAMTLHHFVQRGGVGRLSIDGKGNWSMRFGGSNYFTKERGRSLQNVGVKRQTGSSR